MGYGGHGVYGVGVREREREREREARERGERERRKRDRRLHSPFALHAAIHSALLGGVIKADQGGPTVYRAVQFSI